MGCKSLLATGFQDFIKESDMQWSCDLIALQDFAFNSIFRKIITGLMNRNILQSESLLEINTSYMDKIIFKQRNT